MAITRTEKHHLHNLVDQLHAAGVQLSNPTHAPRVVAELQKVVMQSARDVQPNVPLSRREAFVRSADTIKAIKHMVTGNHAALVAAHSVLKDAAELADMADNVMRNLDAAGKLARAEQPLIDKMLQERLQTSADFGARVATDLAGIAEKSAIEGSQVMHDLWFLDNVAKNYLTSFDPNDPTLKDLDPKALRKSLDKLRGADGKGRVFMMPVKRILASGYQPLVELMRSKNLDAAREQVNAIIDSAGQRGVKLEGVPIDMSDANNVYVQERRKLTDPLKDVAKTSAPQDPLAKAFLLELAYETHAVLGAYQTGTLAFADAADFKKKIAAYPLFCEALICIHDRWANTNDNDWSGANPALLRSPLLRLDPKDVMLDANPLAACINSMTSVAGWVSGMVAAAGLNQA